MRLIADLHIHSPYARAVSKEMTLENLDHWARLKGITVMGTGDFTHPKWMQEIKAKLEPAEQGLYVLKHEARSMKQESEATRFMLTVEIASIYKKGGKVRRIHTLIFAPSIETAEKINTQLGWLGNLKSDGRPILGLDAEELAKIVLNVDPNTTIVPAHCLLPETVIHTKQRFLAPMHKLREGDEVYTHRGRWKKITKVLRRPYTGKVISIKPYYFRLGLTATPEHPFLAIRTKKNCHGSNGICKPGHANDPECTEKYYRRYQPQWVPAGVLEKGDVLIFPRFKDGYSNHAALDVARFAKREVRVISATQVRGGGTRSIPLPRQIPVSKELCRLVGYFLAEGYVNGRDAVGFTFHMNERGYIGDVISLMRTVFGIIQPPVQRKLSGAGLEITFYSKILQELFANLCYTSPSHSAATKAMPSWMLGLAPELQVEILRGWWRGDRGYTASRTLMNQMKIILLRLGIIPSIYEETAARHKARGSHMLGAREIFARHTVYALNRLSFFEDSFGLLTEPEFRHFQSRSKIRHGWLDEQYVYLPIRDIEVREYDGEVYNLEVEGDNSYVAEFAAIHNCWTPWFSVFGSMSGFDSLEECFGEFTPQIFAIETGLSSDPGMNWRLSKLDSIALISNSDSHSLPRIGREANVFETELSYDGIMAAIRSHDPKRFLFTVEFFPEEGRYHYDGHSEHNVRMSPQETKRASGKCPTCGRPVTVGVLSRVEALADRPEGTRPKNAIPFKSMVPLDEIIGEAFDMGVSSKKVKEEYQRLIAAVGSEFRVLLEAPLNELQALAPPEVVEGIRRVREGRLSIEPGYDGLYGTVRIFDEADRKNMAIAQRSLF